ncbi:MAG TPA: hypothetical protein VIR77_00305, partial [Pontiella sp.]
ELMAGMLAASILALAVGSILYYGWTNFKRYGETVSMQRNATIAFYTIEKQIRNAVTVNWDENRIISNGGSNLYAFTEINPELDVELTPPSAGMNNPDISMNVSSGIVLRVALQTRSGTDLGTYRTTIYPRN